MRGEISLITSALLMSTLSIFVRNINANALSITFLRFTTALMFISSFIFITKQKPKVRDLSLVQLSMFNLMTVIFYIYAIQKLEVATAALLLYMAPIYVLPLAWLSGEKVERITWIAIPVGLLGLYLMLTPYASVNLGLIFGVLAGICYAFVFHFSKEARKKHDPFEITFFNLLFSSLVLLPYFALFPPVFSFETMKWSVGLGLVPTAVPFVLFTYGIKYVKVQKAPLFALIEPLSASVIGFAVFGEILTQKQIIGAILIILSISLAWRKSEES